jgi:sugar lactone lactonase YvrE
LFPVLSGLALAVGSSLVPVVVAGGGGADGGGHVLVAMKDPEGLAVDGAGRVCVADRGRDLIHVLDLQRGTAETITGQAPRPNRFKALLSVQHLALDPFGGILFAEEEGRVVHRYDLAGGSETTFAGRYAHEEFDGDGGPATKAALRVHGLACDAEGNVYISGANRIRRVSRRSGLIRTVAGTGKFGFWGDGGPAVAADLANPGAMAIDRHGTLYFSDGANNRIRAIDRKGRIRTVAGNGRGGPPGDGDATRLATGEVVALAVDGDGDLVFVTRARFVRRLLVSQNRLETFFQGPWGALEHPREITGVAVGRDGTVYFDVPRSNALMSLPAADLRKGEGARGARP